MKKLLISALVLIFTIVGTEKNYANRLPTPSILPIDTVGNSDTAKGDYTTNRVSVQLNRQFSTAASAQVISFKLAKRNESAEVIWVTQNESNIESFVLESSTDGISFNCFAKIPAVGKNGFINNYRGIDDLPKDVRFYRLRLIDMSGNEFCTRTISVKREF